MNLFAVSTSPRRCARALDDARLNKMHIETAQMISVELMRRGFKVRYKKTHAGHPVTVWLRREGALLWMIKYFEALDAEWRYRRGTRHASFGDNYENFRRCVAKAVPHRLRRPAFENCARNSGLGLDFSHVRPTMQAYRQYLNARWPTDDNPRWTRRRPPSWCEYETVRVGRVYVLIYEGE